MTWESMASTQTGTWITCAQCQCRVSVRYPPSWQVITIIMLLVGLLAPSSSGQVRGGLFEQFHNPVCGRHCQNTHRPALACAREGDACAMQQAAWPAQCQAPLFFLGIRCIFLTF